MSKKRVTRENVARIAGVSPSTVSRALSGHEAISIETREKILKISADLGYTPSQLSRNYYQNKSFRLGLVIPFIQIHNEFETLPREYFSKLMLGGTATAMNNNFSLQLIPDSGLTTSQLASKVESKEVDGLIITGGKKGDSRFEELFEQKVPFVAIHHYNSEIPYHYVDIDPRGGLEEAINDLKSKSVQNIAYIGSGTEFVNSDDRLTVLKQLTEKYEMSLMHVIQGDYSLKSGYKCGMELLKIKGLDAIFCANDRMAFGLLERCLEVGVKVPETLKIIGFDDQEISILSRPKLTTIENPFFEIGKKAVSMLIKLINGESCQSKKLTSRLILREST